jgi:DNA polymerase-4
MPRCIFHLDLDTFFVAVERRLDPTLQGKPVIVSPGTARSVVATASYEARKFGVHSAMPFSQARRLCPQAVVLPGNFPAYHKASCAFFHILEAFSPDIEPASLDEAYIDYTNCRELFGPPLSAAGLIQQQVKNELGLDLSIGISTSKAVSKIASDLAKPVGILYVRPGYETKLLAPLPIRKLMGIGPKSEPQYRAHGIHTIGGLAQLPRSLVARVFGETGRTLQNMARGEDHSPVQGRQPAKSLSHEETFAHDTTDREFLRHALHRLVCELGYRLRRNNLRAQKLCVKVRYADFSLHTRSQSLPRPTNLDGRLFETAVDLWERLAVRRVHIRLLGFVAQDLVKHEQQLSLPDTQGREQQDNLLTAADKLRSRYGYSVVQWASLLRREA